MLCRCQDPAFDSPAVASLSAEGGRAPVRNLKSANLATLGFYSANTMRQPALHMKIFHRKQNKTTSSAQVSMSVCGCILLHPSVMFKHKVLKHRGVTALSKSVSQSDRLTDMVLQSPSKKLRSGVRKVAAEVWRNSRSAPPSLF